MSAFRSTRIGKVGTPCTLKHGGRPCVSVLYHYGRCIVEYAGYLYWAPSNGGSDGPARKP